MFVLLCYCSKVNPRRIAEFIRVTHEKTRTFAVYARQNSHLGSASFESPPTNATTLAPITSTPSFNDNPISSRQMVHQLVHHQHDGDEKGPKGADEGSLKQRDNKKKSKARKRK